MHRPLQGLVPLAMLLTFVLPGPAARGADGFVIRGTVDCGRSSGQNCTYGPNLTLITDDLGAPGQHVVIEVTAIVGLLGNLDQDDYVEIAVVQLLDGRYYATAVEPETERTSGDDTGNRRPRENSKDQAPTVTSLEVPGTVESSAGSLADRLKQQGYEVLRGYFKLYTLDECQVSFAIMHTCYFNNPAAPYVVPVVPHWPNEFVDPATRGAWGLTQEGYDTTYRLDPREAIVILGQLPPPARYFGLQTYLFTRKGTWDTNSAVYKALASKGKLFTDVFFGVVPNNPGRIINFASLSNNINNVVIQRQSGKAFEQKRFFITTPDRNMDRVVRAQLGEIGIADKDIFTEPIPSTIRIGLQPDSDDFVTGIRYAEPDDGGGQGTPSSKWRNDLPLVVLRVRDARLQRQPETYPPVVLDPRTATDERPLQGQLISLVAAVSQSWGQPCASADCSDRAQAFIDTQSPISAGGLNLVGPSCTEIGQDCLGDTQDTTYQTLFGQTLDAGKVFALVGTLGTRTGNATYVSLGVNDTAIQKGVLNISDGQLADTALAYGGANAGNFYVYYVARNCADLGSRTGGKCLSVPEDVLPRCTDAGGIPCKNVAFVEREYIRPGDLRGPNGDRTRPSTLPSMAIALDKP